VAGKVTDLAALQGTRLGLAVVGGLSVRYGITVNYRPSSRGGTGVVVLLPPQLLAQQRDPGPAEATPRRPVAAPAPRPAEPAGQARSTTDETPGAALPPTTEHRFADPAEALGHDAPRRPRAATSNGLPVRAPGHTMAEAERQRVQRQASADPAGSQDAPGSTRAPVRDAGARFGAFHSGRKSAEGSGTSDTGTWATPGDTDASGADSRSEPPAAP
jgi:hypothetical protein